MTTDADPIIDNWYQHLDKGQKFQVVTVDEDNGLVEIQYFDGDLEEIAFDTWYQLDIEPIEPPEDWTGPIDDVEWDDLGYTETDMEETDWSEPLHEVKSTEGWGDAETGGARDEWGEESGPEEEEYREGKR